MIAHKKLKFGTQDRYKKKRIFASLKYVNEKWKWIPPGRFEAPASHNNTWSRSSILPRKAFE